MLQPVPRTVDGTEESKSDFVSDAKFPSLAERLEAEFPIGVGLAAKVGPTASSMAERFAPQALRATREEAPLAKAPLAKAPLTEAPLTKAPLAEDASLPAVPVEPRLFFAPGQGVFAVLTGVAIAPAVILAGLLWLGAIQGPALVGGVETRPASPQAASHQAAIAGAPALRAAPRAPEIALISPEELVANAGEEIAFAIAIDAATALPARAVIAIHNLPQGASFSKGRPFGSREWSLTPEEVAGLSLRLPANHSGTSDLAVELIAADGAVLARTATRLDVAPAPTAGLVVRSGEQDRVADLMAHGNKMIAVGYFAGARAYYQRAAEAGSGEAALAVGATYDPAFISALQVQGIKPDREAAETWYGRAAALGITDRAGKLASLKRTWTQTGTDSTGDAPQPKAPKPTQAEQTRQAAQPKEKPGPLGRLVAAATELATSEEWVEVANPVNVRKGPSSSDATFKVAQKGAKLRVLGRNGNWVQTADPTTKQEGWIYTRFLKETEAP